MSRWVVGNRHLGTEQQEADAAGLGSDLPNVSAGLGAIVGVPDRGGSRSGLDIGEQRPRESVDHLEALADGAIRQFAIGRGWDRYVGSVGTFMVP
ncbi:hypothetical protein A6E15_01270 [Natrinema saccharevitans]|uniref:Uncharacterized protein n=1 Tax=Natrinema saccharevitans TaxID=301967 RepID=A0A1S8ASY7_9EURY|nr:hypothetical protein [Natrinema saccharevitans]OLZ39696.1 hypothetical protein A6E15_01270 [Natrinema saccharevitans]